MSKLCYLPKCANCAWQDKENAQCFDGHLQSDEKCYCEGFVYSEHKVLEKTFGPNQDIKQCAIFLFNQMTVMRSSRMEIRFKDGTKFTAIIDREEFKDENNK